MIAEIINRMVRDITASALKKTVSVVGNGNKKSESHFVASFKMIKLQIPANTTIVTGVNKAEVVITADDNLHQFIDISVDNEILILSKPDEISLQKNQVEVLIKVPNFLEYKEVFGSGIISSDDEILTNGNFEVVVSGSGEIALTLAKTDKTISRILGSGHITLKSNSPNFIASVNGSGSINALNLQTENSKVDIIGSGMIEVSASIELTGTIVGSGKVVYLGNPKVNIKTNGNGQIIKANQTINQL
jgi:Putative auto-transporter adhesin, head GIN domain